MPRKNTQDLHPWLQLLQLKDTEIALAEEKKGKAKVKVGRPSSKFKKKSVTMTFTDEEIKYLDLLVEALEKNSKSKISRGQLLGSFIFYILGKVTTGPALQDIVLPPEVKNFSSLFKYLEKLNAQ